MARGRQKTTAAPIKTETVEVLTPPPLPVREVPRPVPEPAKTEVVTLNVTDVETQYQTQIKALTTKLEVAKANYASTVSENALLRQKLATLEKRINSIPPAIKDAVLPKAEEPEVEDLGVRCAVEVVIGKMAFGDRVFRKGETIPDFPVQWLKGSTSVKKL